VLDRVETAEYFRRQRLNGRIVRRDVRIALEVRLHRLRVARCIERQDGVGGNLPWGRVIGLL
jgi:hypothetical protein